MQSSQRHILVAVSGNTPQIVTETLYALMLKRKPPVPISAIYVMTTAKGKKIAWKSLGGKDGAIAEFCRSYELDPCSIAFTEKHLFVFKSDDGADLEDIRTTQDNLLLQKQMLGFIKELTKDPNTILHCSMGGGRRTMSAYMLLAMTVYGREEDSLTHVLVTEAFETNPDFFFPPKKSKKLAVRNADNKWIVTDTKEAKIELADIPFARLRSLFGANINDLEADIGKLIDIAQVQIESIQPQPDKLTVDLRNGRVFFGRQEITLNGFHLALFSYYADAKARPRKEPEVKTPASDERETDNEGYCSPGEINIPRLVRIYGSFDKRLQEEATRRQKISSYRKSKAFRDNVLSSHTRINKVIEPISAQLMVTSKKKQGLYAYGLKLDQNLIEIIKPEPKK